jgi:hypothetical protein
MTFTEFKNQYNGQSNVGNTAANRGQCVGLVSLWMDNFKIAHVWGDAKDLYANASDKDFAKIPNDPTAIPQQGDIIVWSSAFNGGVGHTGIASGKADVNTFECFEQNDPIGSSPHLKTYNYAYVTGWLRPIVAQTTATDAISVPKATFEDLVRKATAFDIVCDYLKFDKSTTDGSRITIVLENFKDELLAINKSLAKVEAENLDLQAKLNQTATVPPSDIPTGGMAGSGDSTAYDITGGGAAVPNGSTTNTTSVGNAGSGDSPEVVPQEAQGIQFLAPIFYNIVNWFKSIWKKIMG